MADINEHRDDKRTQTKWKICMEDVAVIDLDIDGKINRIN
jgi:hypothetical protein